MRRESRAVRQSREQRDSATRWLAERMRSRPRSARLPRARTPASLAVNLGDISQAAPSSELQSPAGVTRVSAVGDAITNYAVDACSTNSEPLHPCNAPPDDLGVALHGKEKLRLPPRPASRRWRSHAHDSGHVPLELPAPAATRNAPAGDDELGVAIQPQTSARVVRGWLSPLGELGSHPPSGARTHRACVIMAEVLITLCPV